MNSIAHLAILTFVSYAFCNGNTKEQGGNSSSFLDLLDVPSLRLRQYYFVSPAVYPGIGGYSTGFPSNVYGINRPLGLGQSGAPIFQPGMGQIGAYGIQGYQVLPQMVVGSSPMAFAASSVTPPYGYSHGSYGYGGHGGGHHG